MHHITLKKTSKALVAMMTGCFALLAGIDNLLDYMPNYKLLSQTLSMSSMPSWFTPSKHLSSRAIHSPLVFHIAYHSIIGTEILIGLLCIAAGVLLFFASSQSPYYCRAKNLYTIGASLALALWYFGFVVIGGEYFSMWASNPGAQQTAFFFASFFLLSLLYIVAPE